MNYRVFIIALVFFKLPFYSFCQKKDSLSRKLDSLFAESYRAGVQKNDINEAAYNSNTRIRGPIYFKLLGSDFKQHVIKPFNMMRRNWLKLGIFSGITGILLLTDERIQRGAVKLSEQKEWVADVSNVVTRFGGIAEAGVLVLLGSTGFVFKNQKLKTTTLLATQSYLISGVIAPLLKEVFGRQRPNLYDPLNPEPEPKFHGPFFDGGRDNSGKKLNKAFPSGHATAAFSAATVFAMEYRDKKLVPIIAYTAAGLIAISRITENKHWFTDVFVGAMLGYISGRQVANNYHRYAKIKEGEQLKNSLQFKLDYNQGIISPGLVYRFR